MHQIAGILPPKFVIFNYLPCEVIFQIIGVLTGLFNILYNPLNRLFWILIVCFSTYFTLIICLDQWKRYENNPIVVTLETNHREWVYGPPGFTLCSSYIDNETITELVLEYWGTNASDSPEQFKYYASYLQTISTTNLKNLEQFGRFKNATDLNRVDMLYVARQVLYHQSNRSVKIGI